MMSRFSLLIQLALAIGVAHCLPQGPVDDYPRFILPAPTFNGSVSSMERGLFTPPACSAKNGNLPTNKNGIIGDRYRWRDFNVFIDEEFSDNDRQLINNGLYELSQALPCVTFGIWPRGSQPGGDYVHITNQGGCWSYIGKLGGRQDMSLDRAGGCVHNTVIIHESIHALGFDHEHNRANRDDFINVHVENVSPGQEHNFEKVGSGYSDFGIPYSTQSIMHYHSEAFSRDGRAMTMTTKSGGQIPYNFDFRQSDKDKLRAMYNC